jgi:hypothetical protein
MTERKTTKEAEKNGVTRPDDSARARDCYDLLAAPVADESDAVRAYKEAHKSACVLDDALLQLAKDNCDIIGCPVTTYAQIREAVRRFRKHRALMEKP